jgi:hypothetical protein
MDEKSDDYAWTLFTIGQFGVCNNNKVEKVHSFWTDFEHTHKNMGP